MKFSLLCGLSSANFMLQSFRKAVCLSVSLSVGQSEVGSVSLSVSLSMSTFSLSDSLSIYQSVGPIFYSVNLAVCLFIRLSMDLYVRLSCCQSVYWPVDLSFYQNVSITYSMYG